MSSLGHELALRLLCWLQGSRTEERGQTLAEYGLILTLIAVGITVLALVSFRETLITGYNMMSSCLTGSCGS